MSYLTLAFKNVPYQPPTFTEVMFQIDMYGPDPLNADPDPGSHINPDPCQALYVP